MDDPWGSSPWADEVQVPHSIELEHKHDDEPRPTTPIAVATLKPEDKSNSPWNDTDDDGFGDWASLPADSNIELDFGGRNDAWDGSAPALTVTPKAESNTLSLNWDDEQDSKSMLAPNSTLDVKDIAREPSPDPWSTSFTTDDNFGVGIKSNTPKQEEPKNCPQKEDTATYNFAPEAVDAADTSEVLAVREETLADENAAIHDIEEDEDSLSTKAESVPEEPDHIVQITVIAGDSTDGDPASSRPSSSPSEHSQHDELSQESPRTSLDEEPNRPQTSRKVSSKVQELVQHFDGLAKTEVVDVAASSTSSGQDTVKGGNGSGQEEQEEDEGDEEEDDDFGDFEGGGSDDEQDEDHDSKAIGGFAPPVQEPPAKELTHHSEPSSTKQTHRVAIVGPVHFDVDLTVVDGLFPNLPEVEPFEEIFVPDTIIHDTFSTIEERKVWTRISRYGTMKKHDTGDDDYVRINWAQSQIRKDTLNIVARWMEEDRSSGRVVLGGGSKGSSIFGWNDKKKLAPVPLSQALSAKSKPKVETVVEKPPEIPREWPQGLTRKVSTSKSSPPRTGRQPAAKPVAAPEQVQSAIETPIANFGWNAAPKKSHSLDNHSLSGHKVTASMSKVASHYPRVASPLRRSTSAKRASVNGTTAITTHNQNPALPPPSSTNNTTARVSIPKGPPLAIANLVEDDDWGEMVASPIISSTPVDLPVNPPPLKASSMDIPIAFTSQPSSQPLTATKHQSPPNLDDIFNPTGTSLGAEHPTTNALLSSAFASASMSHPQTVSTPVAPATDPWASADFSIFDATPAPIVTAAKPIPQIKSKPVSKSVSFSPSPLPPIREGRLSREETEQNRIVQSVVKSLPDLSYMFRR